MPSGRAHEIIQPDNGIGRYRLPLALPQRLLLKVLRKIARHAPVAADRSPVFATDLRYPVPFEWQQIIEYLYREGALASPRVSFEPSLPDEPQLYALRLWAAPSKTDGEPVISLGGYSRGVSYDLDEALGKVVGEFLERYPLTLYRDRELLVSSISDLRKKGVDLLDPRLADQFSDAQKERFPRRKFDDQSMFRFVKGRSLTKNVEAYIPAQMIFINYKYAEGEPILRQPISNGAAGMFTYDEAVVAGLYELIQRDAFLTHWLTNTAPPVIDPDSLTDVALLDCIADLEHNHLDFRILDTTSDIGVPAFVAVLIDESGRGPAITLGGGCGLDQEKAILRALTEAIGVRSALREWQERREDKTLPEMADAEPFTKDWGARTRLLLWYDRKTIPLIMPFLSGAVVSLDPARDRHFADPKAELESILGECASRGEAYEVFVYQAKRRILDKLGYVSVRVCIPALLPLYLRETYAPLAAVRIKGKVTNTLPHPFP